MTTEYFHQPVLLAEAIEQLNCKQGSTIVDCTLGGAGHARSIAKAIAPGGTLVGLDVDNEAITVAKDVLAPFGQQIDLHVVRASYVEMDQVLTEIGTGLVDGFLFDFGVSSHQVDNPERGFSYSDEGPLDMRMDLRQELTAKRVVNEYPEEKLSEILRMYGEERFAKRIAHFICEKRKEKLIETTKELVEVIKSAMPAAARRGGPHPAKRTFQALRIEVNNELQNIEKGLMSALCWLRKGGRIVAISYHSLEDRIVKRRMIDWGKRCI